MIRGFSCWLHVVLRGRIIVIISLLIVIIGGDIIEIAKGMTIAIVNDFHSYCFGDSKARDREQQRKEPEGFRFWFRL